VSITYEANLNCDGKDCKTVPITLWFKNVSNAKNVVVDVGYRNGWATIEDEHYCPDCGEVFKG